LTTPRRQAGIHQRLHQVIGRERRVGGRLDDAGLRKPAPGRASTRDGHGKIPRVMSPTTPPACGRSWQTCLEVLTGWSGRRAAVLRRLHRRLHRWPPAHPLWSPPEPLPISRVIWRACCSLRSFSSNPARTRISAAWGRNQPPRCEGLFSGSHPQRHIFGVGRGKWRPPHPCGRRGSGSHGFAAHCGQPLAANQILIRRIGHGNLEKQESELGVSAGESLPRVRLGEQLSLPH